jgi:hypothetical protein
MTTLALGVLGVVALVIVAIFLPRRTGTAGKDRKPPVTRNVSRAPTPSPAATGIAAPAPAPPRPSPSSRSKGVRPETVDRFRGSTLFPQPGACAAAQNLRGKTFEGAEVLKVPVPGCDRSRCECQIHAIVGRRRGPRRVSQDRRTDVRFSSERRSGSDRREGAETWQQAKD